MLLSRGPLWPCIMAAAKMASDICKTYQQILTVRLSRLGSVQCEVTCSMTCFISSCMPQVQCKVEGGEDSFLTLTGACSQTQAQATTLDFKAAVRGSSSQTLTLANPSVTPWQLKPVIQNDYWSGPEVLMVPAGAEAAYAITYRPLSMSTQEKQHEGSVFFPIPDGTGLLYKLSGVAQSPMSAGTIQCQVNLQH